jgi:hypothetical protein
MRGGFLRSEVLLYSWPERKAQAQRRGGDEGAHIEILRPIQFMQRMHHTANKRRTYIQGGFRPQEEVTPPTTTGS